MMRSRAPRHAPVIVIGMHRSGTSALVRSLAGLGLFTGHDLEPNAEARFFLNLNEQMLHLAGARWDAPASLLRLLQDDDLVDWLVRWLDGQLSGYGTRLYFSKPGWLRYRDIRNYPRLWGWKDPRNTLTLPVWLRLFPEAKVIHVLRHAVDVAASLRERERTLRRVTLAANAATEAWKLTSPRCLDLEYGFSLWEQYVSAGEAALSAMPDGQKLTLRFEDWLDDPEKHLQHMNDWFGLAADSGRLHQVASGLRAERGFAYERSDELLGFARSHCLQSPWMQRHYSERSS